MVNRNEMAIGGLDGIDPPSEPLHKRAVVCNLAVTLPELSRGTLAYVSQYVCGRIRLIARSRGGRWVTLWQPVERLANFRIKNLPRDHPLFDRLNLYPTDGEGDVLVNFIPFGAGQGLALR